MTSKTCALRVIIWLAIKVAGLSQSAVIQFCPAQYTLKSNAVIVIESSDDPLARWTDRSANTTSHLYGVSYAKRTLRGCRRIRNSGDLKQRRRLEGCSARHNQQAFRCDLRQRFVGRSRLLWHNLPLKQCSGLAVARFRNNAAPFRRHIRQWYFRCCREQRVS